MSTTEVQGADMRRLLDTLATQYGGSVDELLGAAGRGSVPPPIAKMTPPPIAAEAPVLVAPPTIEVEPQPWQRPSWATAAAPVTRAGADIHMRSATAMAVCGATETPLASVADPTQVTCRACRLMISAPHISPCTTERWLRDTPEPEPAPALEAPAPARSRTGQIVAGAVAAAAIVGAVVVAVVALAGHSGSAANTSANTTTPSDVHTVGGGVPEPTAYSTALPTVEPSASPSPSPTATPAPTAPPAVQNQAVTVIDTNGQSQQQQSSQAQSSGSGSASATADPPADPPAATSITFINDAGHVVDLYWSHGGTETEYNTIEPGYQVVAHTYVGQTWVVKTDPCCVGGGGNVVLLQVTATAAPQTEDVTAQ